VLVGSDELVIIDLPQAIVAARNNNAAGMLERDVANMTAYFGCYAPELLATDYGREIWKHYATGKLSPETRLTGRFEQSSKPADVRGVLRDVEAAQRWHERSS
jgi:RIO kinase 1